VAQLQQALQAAAAALRQVKQIVAALGLDLLLLGELLLVVVVVLVALLELLVPMRVLHKPGQGRSNPEVVVVVDISVRAEATADPVVQAMTPRLQLLVLEQPLLAPAMLALLLMVVVVVAVVVVVVDLR
jgi:ketopantoate hydroxymethyltransferase